MHAREELGNKLQSSSLLQKYSVVQKPFVLVGTHVVTYVPT